MANVWLLATYRLIKCFNSVLTVTVVAILAMVLLALIVYHVKIILTYTTVRVLRVVQINLSPKTMSALNVQQTAIFALVQVQINA